MVKQRPATCQGQGRVRVRQQIGPFVNEVVQDCRECGGSGSMIDSPCTDCSGRGHRDEEKPFDSTCQQEQNTAHVYACEVKDNLQNGQGSQGDLLIEIEVLTHPWFERNGSDLIMSLPLGYPDLVLGTKISIDHIDGKKLDIVVPPVHPQVIPSKSRNEGCLICAEVAVAMLLFCSNFTFLIRFKGGQKQLESMKSSLNPSDQVQRILDDASERRANE